MTQIPMFVFGDERFGRFVKPAGEMPIVRKNSRNFEKNSRNRDRSWV